MRKACVYVDDDDDNDETEGGGKDLVVIRRSTSDELLFFFFYLVWFDLRMRLNRRFHPSTAPFLPHIFQTCMYIYIYIYYIVILIKSPHNLRRTDANILMNRQNWTKQIMMMPMHAETRHAAYAAHTHT